MSFQKAQRIKARLRLGITGPSGSGKTLGALMIAKGIGGKIALLDTERGSASLYAEPVRLTGGALWQPPAFDTQDLEPPYAPERFIEKIKEAEAAGYDILIIDSTTHEWNGIGGALELVDQIAGAKFRGNSWSAWNEMTPRHRAFIDAMLRSPMHIIATMRSKTETAQTEENGRKKVVKLGMKSEQRDGIEYEFTTVLDITHGGHFALASKDRTGLFGGDPTPISEETGQRLMDWLESGAVPLPTPADLAIALLQDARSGPEFKAVWEENRTAWKEVMSASDYARTVGEMQRLAGKWAPPKTAEERDHEREAAA